ncbi:MAG TPA: glycosyltransferase family 2 protein [Candidatus Saccharimonadales bacterium]|nr:glycosyltransferase family 2 protein [Candidatus Saccharimonadales bacterium]
MKVVVQIPCLNEEATLPLVLQTIPRHIDGVDELVVLVIDDGSKDRTVEIAREHGVTHFVRHTRNQGLARSFHDGVNYALSIGADIVVNTDGDNQYPQDRIGDLVRPIIDGQADLVIADRQTQDIVHFSALKKFLQRFGSMVVNKAAATDLPDAVSGFRAYSRESLMRINTVTRFSYTTETIIQAGQKHLAIASIPITTNAKTRESRLFKSMRQMVFKQAVTIVRAFVMYRPHLVFGTLGYILLVLGLIPFARFLYFVFVEGSSRGHIQSLLFGIMFMTGAFLCLVLNIIADLIRINRILIEDNLEHTKRMRFDKRQP